MANNVIALNSVRTERWLLTVNAKAVPFILCFYNENKQCWVGAVDARTVDEMMELLGRARGVMRSARAQNRRIEVPV